MGGEGCRLCLTDQGLYRREMQVNKYSLLHLFPPARSYHIPAPQPPSPLISQYCVCVVILVAQVLDTCVGLGIPVAGLVGGGYSKDIEVGWVDEGAMAMGCAFFERPLSSGLRIQGVQIECDE